MSSCAFCGRDNAEGSRFCIDCGKPLSSSATASVVPATIASQPKPTATHRRPSPSAPRRASAEPAYAIVPPGRVQPSGATVNCGWCGSAIEAGLPFCAHCGRRTDAKLITAASCATCGSTVRESDTFCSTCGAPLHAPEEKPEGEVRTLVFNARRRDVGARIAVLDESGAVRQTIPLGKPEMTVGRGACDIAFGDDPFLSPLHAQFIQRDGAVYVRDLGSCNRTWVFIDAPHVLADDDFLLLGSQLLQFRRIGFPAPMHPDADGTRRIGSMTPGPDVALLAQLRSDGSVRDEHHLSAGRSLAIGRDTGDWTFPYDQTMSGRHAEIREEDGQFVIHDLGSRNGIAVAVRGDRQVKPGQRVLVGDQVLRLESA
ncbi:MAG TPA: FHA domain-containing protein [Gemmatimonadaceae bacterium]